MFKFCCPAPAILKIKYITTAVAAAARNEPTTFKANDAVVVPPAVVVPAPLNSWAPVEDVVIPVWAAAPPPKAVPVPAAVVPAAVVPAVERIFNVLGYKKDDLLETKDQTKLEGFF